MNSRFTYTLLTKLIIEFIEIYTITVAEISFLVVHVHIIEVVDILKVSFSLTNMLPCMPINFRFSGFSSRVIHYNVFIQSIAYSTSTIHCLTPNNTLCFNPECSEGIELTRFFKLNTPSHVVVSYPYTILVKTLLS